MNAPARINRAAVETVLLDLRAEPHLVSRWHAMIGRDERAHAARIRDPRARDRFIARRARLRETLAVRLGQAPEEVRIEPDPNGKLVLPDAPWLHFNLSSSHHLALVALADVPVGCDIEFRDGALACPKVAERLFSAREVDELRALRPDQWATGFYNVWTRKEAYVKALGLGLSYPLDRFDVTVTPGAPAAITRGGEGWRLLSFQPAPDFQAAVAIG
ncbi:4'-phosphopantetheinyl transferase superfamily protein [Sphingomonas sp.]|uniref:4'-phosphopantetheinyl transferase family protein n=1 Tax=Sphingomonas sp. TaxID=28214 RepID=UPI001EC85CB5|nr:4'-phosphopantetheinyl transferase superfamily protein [Sphingomonas sp.]MBX3593369.1 4'-phosphopantetheinyl transferase superfamily protein [Sphingomonas sp.]